MKAKYIFGVLILAISIKVYGQNGLQVVNNTKDGIHKVLNEHYDPVNFISPLHIGNYFEYLLDVFSYQSYYAITVIKDTVFQNGMKYYKLQNGGSGFTFEYIDSISLKWYRYDFNCPEENFLIIDFLADTGYVFNQCNSDDKIIDKGITSNFLGDTTHLRYSKKYPYPFPFDANVETYVEKFGFAKSEGFGFVITLTGAVIDGITYGTIHTSVQNVSNEIPEKFSIYQNYPNPFNPVTKIKFDIMRDVRRETRDVRLVVYDALGKEVTTLVNEKLSAGSYEVEFDGSNLSSGIYFYKLESENFSDVKRMILLK